MSILRIIPQVCTRVFSLKSAWNEFDLLRVYLQLGVALRCHLSSGVELWLLCYTSYLSRLGVKRAEVRRCIYINHLRPHVKQMWILHTIGRLQVMWHDTSSSTSFARSRAKAGETSGGWRQDPALKHKSLLLLAAKIGLIRIFWSQNLYYSLPSFNWTSNFTQFHLQWGPIIVILPWIE